LRNVAREVVTEHVGRSQIMHPGLKPLLGRDWNVVGPAVTVDLDAFDHLMCVAALGVAQPGDVVVVAARGLTDLAVWGGGLTTSAKLLGVEAIVVDGAVMDTRAILAREVPVFCRGSHPAHGTRERPGSVNVPVNCGGVIVHPGDVILGDLDGLIVVRRENAAQVLAACEEKSASLRRAAAAMSGGAPRTFFDLIGGKDTIRRAGVDWVD
jgi:4-hydroxy-4-methyl-2-oxoglutarate aldolase